jgi:hypothetical protein
VFFHEQTPAAIAAAVEEFERVSDRIAPHACRDNARRFAVEVFRERYASFVEACWEQFKTRASAPHKVVAGRVRAHG